MTLSVLFTASAAALTVAGYAGHYDPYVDAYAKAMAVGRYPWMTPDPNEIAITCSGLPAMSFCDCDGDCTQNPEFCVCDEAQACCAEVEAPAPSSCTPLEGDPWSTGTFVPCCEITSQECLRSNVWAYRCQECSMECPADSDWDAKCGSAEPISSLPAPPGPSDHNAPTSTSDGPSTTEDDTCTPEFSDPWSSGSFTKCCEGDEFQPCLREDVGWAYRCNSCAAECPDDADWNARCAKSLPAPTPRPTQPPTDALVPPTSEVKASCTPEFADPWLTGVFVPCCGDPVQNYQPCLEEDKGWSFRCHPCASSSCPDDPKWSAKCGRSQ